MNNMNYFNIRNYTLLHFLNQAVKCDFQMLSTTSNERSHCYTLLLFGFNYLINCMFTEGMSSIDQPDPISNHANVKMSSFTIFSFDR